MIIANPIYDTTFKKVMESKTAAKTLIGTILGCDVLSLVESPTERTKEKITQPGSPTLYRLDYAAVIKDKDNTKQKVMIEVQKTFDESDIYRFREYLGNEYIKSKLPILTIYILGFKLKVASPAFVTGTGCYDIRTHKPVAKKDDIVKKLTHTAYFIQTKRIDPCDNTLLDQLLTIFQQKKFINGSKSLQPLLINNVDPKLYEIIKILESIANNSKLVGKMDDEYEELKRYERFYGDKIRKELEREKILAEKEKREIEREKVLAEKEKREIEREKVIAEKEKREIEREKILAEKEKTIEATIRHLAKSGMPLQEISHIMRLDINEINKIMRNETDDGG